MITRLVPQTAPFSNSFYQNLHDIYNLKDVLINEGLLDNNVVSTYIQRKTDTSLLPLRN